MSSRGRMGSYRGGSTLLPSGPVERAPSLLLLKSKKTERKLRLRQQIEAGSALNGLSNSEVKELTCNEEVLLASGVVGAGRLEFVAFADKSIRRLQTSGIITDREVAAAWNDIGFLNGLGNPWIATEVAVLRLKTKSVLAEARNNRESLPHK